MKINPKQKASSLLGLLLCICLFSCNKIVFDKDGASSDPMKNFEYLWSQCDTKYSYFDVKGINWDSIKTIYAQKIYSGMSEDSLFNVLGAMLTELRDDHTNLISYFNISRFNGYLYNKDNFDLRVVEEHYLTPHYTSTGPFYHNFVDSGEIGYVYFPSFPGSVDNQNLDYVLDKYKDTKGLILDLRQNGGGAVTDVFALLSRFVDSRTLVYYSRIKSGPGHDDFSEAEAAYVDPYDGQRYTKKIAVLTDRGTFSAGSFTALATKAIPNIILIGDTTGGGLGLPNGGQLPNGWNYRFSVTQALTLDKKPDYENGVPPDINASFDWSDLSKDEIIERAILELQ